jgi:plastocyanin
VVTVAVVTEETSNSTQDATTSTTGTKHRRLARRALGVAAGLTLVMAFGVGCGSSGDSTSGPTTTAAAGENGSGGGASSGGSSGCTEAKNGTIEVVTTNFDFSPDCITTTGDRLKVTYDNKEDGVQHNIDFKDAKSSTGDAKTELKAGPNVQTVTLVDLKPGTYTYVCDIHSSMKGELTVK